MVRIREVIGVTNAITCTLSNAQAFLGELVYDMHSDGDKMEEFVKKANDLIRLSEVLKKSIRDFEKLYEIRDL